MRLPPLSRIEYPCVYAPDEKLGFRFVPGASGRKASHFEIDNEVRINSAGFHDREPPAAGAADPVILGVGDSFTAGIFVTRDESWTAAAERRLRASGRPDVAVINAGIDGTGTDVHVSLMEELSPRFRPRIVVLAFYGNDFFDVQVGRLFRECYRGTVLAYPDDESRDLLRRRVDALESQWFRRFLFEHLYLARLYEYLRGGVLNPWRMNYLQRSRAELGLDDAALARRRPAVAEALDRLEAFASRCDCQVLVVPVPPRSDPDGSLRLFQAETRGRSFDVVDVLPAMQEALGRDGRGPEALYFVHDDHLNAYGLRLYGEAVADEIARRLDARSGGADWDPVRPAEPDRRTWPKRVLAAAPPRPMAP